MTTGVTAQLSHVQKRDVSPAAPEKPRLCEKNLVERLLPVHPLTQGQYMSRNQMVYGAGQFPRNYGSHIKKSDRILGACTIYLGCCKGLNLSALPVSTDPHPGPGDPEGYYRLNPPRGVMISSGDEGQVKLKGSLKQARNDPGPQCTGRLNQVAFGIRHPPGQQLCPPCCTRAKPRDSKPRALVPAHIY